MNVPLSECEVVAYSTSLSKDMVPTTVCPIFWRKSDGMILYPESVHDGEIQVGGTDDRKRLEEYADQGRVTLINSPFQAKADYTLWIDEAMRPHYGPIQEVQDFLNAFYDYNIRMALEFLKKEDWEKADYHAGLALCANGCRVECLAVRYVVRFNQGRTISLKVVKKLVDEKKTEEFERLVKEYGGLI